MVAQACQEAKGQSRGVLPRQQLLQVLGDALRQIVPPWVHQSSPLHDLHASSAIQRLEAGGFNEQP